MRKVFSGVCVLFLLAIGAAHAEGAQTLGAKTLGVEALGWLGGCWVQADGSRRIDETWLPPAGGVMLGVGRTVKAGALREYEYTRISTINGVLTYTAELPGQAATDFAAISQTSGEIVFENKAHDFPQRVIYRTLGADRLQAAIEGSMGGTTRTITFDYKRCDAG